MTAQPATGPWRRDEPPKDGSHFLVLLNLDGYGCYCRMYWSETFNQFRLVNGEGFATSIPRWAELNSPDAEAK
uniref:Uncharacterized protein n=1 Tax=viral metagenome TaxID=1070528 RepID=A0A6M3IT04_9ZZZZ